MSDFYRSDSHGTENYYRHALIRTVVFTDGVKDYCEEFGAFWFVDIIASYQTSDFRRKNPFQCWYMGEIEKEKLSQDIICEDGNDNELLRQSVCTWASDERPRAKVFVAPQDDLMVIMMPSEY